MGTLLVDTPLAIAFDLAAVAALLLAALWVVGWPVRVLLFGSSTARHHVAATPLVGLAVLQTAGWYGAMRPGGIRVTVLAVCAAGALASATLGMWRFRRRGQLDVDAALRRVPIVVLMGVASTGLFAFHYQESFTHDPTVPVTAGNNDIAAYAITAQHLLAHGFDEPGSVVGTHVGSLARHDVFGAYAVLVVGSTATGIDVWATLLPALLVAGFLCVLSMYCLVRGCSSLARAPAAAVAVLSCGSFLFVYIEMNYFLSQVVAMATTGLLFLLALDATRSAGLRPFLRIAGIAVPLVVCTLFTYPHMVYLGVPVVVGLAAVAAAAQRRSLREAAKAVGRAGALGATVVVATFLVSPARFVEAFDRTIALSDIPAGWPLPLVTPAQLLGFQRSWTPTPSALNIVASVVIVGGSLVCAAVLRRRARAALEPFAALAVGVLASYAAAYARYGTSYNQWKWISYFQPLLVVGLVVPFTLAVREAVRRVYQVRRLAGVAAVALPLVLACAATVNARYASKTAVTEVDEALLDLEGHPQLAQLDALNVDLAPYWQTMWGMYAAIEAGVDSVNPHSLSYYPTSPHAAAWTLRATDDVRPVRPGREVVELNAGYHLVRYATEPPAEGTFHVMRGCMGLYRYTGGRWVALARTPASGQYRFAAVVRFQPGRRDPVLVRGSPGRADVVGMRHLDGNRLVFFHEHVPGDTVQGRVVAVDPTTPVVLDIVLDETTDTVRVNANGQVVLDVQRPLHRLGELPAAEGVNAVGANVEPSFSGTLHGIAVTTDTCRALAASNGLAVP